MAVEDESKWFVLRRFTAIGEIETVSTSWYSDGRRGRYHVCMQEYAINEYMRLAVVSSSWGWCAGAWICGTEDGAKMDFPFLFRTSDFSHKVAEVLGLLGAFRGSSGYRPPKILLLRR